MAYQSVSGAIPRLPKNPLRKRDASDWLQNSESLWFECPQRV